MLEEFSSLDRFKHLDSDIGKSKEPGDPTVSELICRAGGAQQLAAHGVRRPGAELPGAWGDCRPPGTDGPGGGRAGLGQHARPANPTGHKQDDRILAAGGPSGAGAQSCPASRIRGGGDGCHGAVGRASARSEAPGGQGPEPHPLGSSGSMGSATASCHQSRATAGFSRAAAAPTMSAPPGLVWGAPPGLAQFRTGEPEDGLAPVRPPCAAATRQMTEEVRGCTTSVYP